MKRNLSLLMKHRKKMAWIVSTVVTLLIMFSIVLTYVLQYESEATREDQELMIKATRVKNITLIDEIVIPQNKPKVRAITQATLLDSRVYNGSGVLTFDSMTGGVHLGDIVPGKITVKGEHKYFALAFSGTISDYTVIVRVSSSSSKMDLFMIGVKLLALSAAIFLLNLFFSYTIVDRLFSPAKELIINLEGFASNINHEFKTSLSEVLSTLELTQITGQYDDAVREAISSTHHLDDVLDSLGMLIHFVNAEYRKERVNIMKLLDTGIGEFQTEIEKKRITLVKKYDPKKVIFRFLDAQPLLLCFRNILKNAIRYSHEGGTIEIMISDDMFVIKDYGVGINKESIPKIFDRYFRENYSGQGTGIGLSLVKRVTEIYDWNVTVESVKGQYTQFALQFYKRDS